ncbi:MAG: hypothetical protein ABWZ66_09805 [Pyrinomonadaceae bacterium]
MFRAEFGHLLLKPIAYDDLRAYKIKRLKIPVVINYFLKIEMADEEKLLCHFNKKYRYENPTASDSLISHVTENECIRILLAGEEKRLIAACTES